MTSKARQITFSAETVVVLVFSLTYLSLIAYVTRDCLMDDAYIGFRYIDNLLSGRGFTFNPPEHIEGVTNIGWLLLLTPFCTFLKITTAAKVLGYILASATILLSLMIIQKVGGTEEPHPLWILPLPLLVATQFDFVYFSMAGMETALLSTIFCLIVYFSMLDRFHIFSALLCAYAYLVHPESVLIFPLAMIAGLISRSDNKKNILWPVVLFTILIMIITGARFAYFHDILPNTFYSKTSGIRSMAKAGYELLKGWNTNVSSPFGNAFSLLLLCYGILVLWQKQKSAAIFSGAIIIVGLAFCVWAEQDWTFMGRYFASYTPVAYILVCLALLEIKKKMFGDSTAGRAAAWTMISACSLMLVSLGVGDAFYHLRKDYTETYPGFVLTGRNLVAPALWMRDNLPQDCTIATRRIGALSFYTGRRILDYKFGLVDRDIARLRKATGEDFSFPISPALKDIWQKAAPDYFLEDEKSLEAMVKKTGDTMERFEIHGLSYRPLKKFPIARDLQWVLCKRVK